VQLSAPERSCASERGGTLFLLREAIQHWLSADLEPQLRAHQATVQQHRRECTDRRRKPPTLLVQVRGECALTVALVTLALTGLPNARATLAFARKFLEHDSVLLTFSVNEFYNAMWCDERRVTSSGRFGRSRCVAPRAAALQRSMRRATSIVALVPRPRRNATRRACGSRDG
jgi:hypothetical protein